MPVIEVEQARIRGLEQRLRRLLAAVEEVLAPNLIAREPGVCKIYCTPEAVKQLQDAVDAAKD